ncbi:MAG: FlgD immunoglobulin-like domain containing protein [Candidatus Cloacimonetes bacterium]|nr:T9SS type A sorting domain-containing protein [Candidatus Cloacimonas sp.]MDD3734461.1 FlgD immunoglobulin-like domain containing protein [Candidatus Cloacimonadota bacterium]
MNKYSAIVLMGIALWTCSIQAGVIIVAADGTGQVTSIQAGINLAAVGDTVLISPGVWTGVVVIDNKPITIGSFYIINSDTTYIAQTTIDGEDTRTGIIVKNCSGVSDTLQIIGLTIRNCRSSWYPDTYMYSIGGGIGIGLSIAKVCNCKIFSNRAYFGGGIGVSRAQVYLFGNEIFANNAITSGGGLSGLGYNNLYIYFDAENKNSIYLNNASRGCDISYAFNNVPTSIYLNKGTINSLDQYFFFLPDQTPLYIDQPMMEQVNYDLWVSPDGSNANTGFSPQSPLKNISFALAKIQPIGNNPLTVHILPGSYSWHQTGEALPLQPKSYVNLIGSDMENVILDAEQYGTFICGKDAQDYMNIKNMTLINGHSTHYYLFYLDDYESGHTDSITVENIHIRDSWATSAAFVIASCYNITVNNLIIEDTQVGIGFFIYCYETGCFTNFRVQRLSPTNIDAYNTFCQSGGIQKSFRASSSYTTINISNFLIADNVDTSQYWENMTSGLSISVEGGNCDLNINNCTIANNSTTTEGAGFGINLENCNAQVNNTIVSGNTPYEVAMFAFNESTFADVSFNNCLVSGGSDSFFILGGDITHTWMDGNMFGYPSFLGGDTNNPLYYSLASNSPCIDSGTPDTANLDLPPYDLAGNWRIWNGRIDMGCYEYDSEPWISINDPFLPQPESTILLQNYPNPFNPSTTICYSVPTDGEVNLAIYNAKGQLINTLISGHRNKGNYQIVWQGKDAKGNSVASGLYFTRLVSGGKTVTKKMLLMK